MKVAIGVSVSYVQPVTGQIETTAHELHTPCSRVQFVCTEHENLHMFLKSSNNM